MPVQATRNYSRDLDRTNGSAGKEISTVGDVPICTAASATADPTIQSRFRESPCLSFFHPFLPLFFQDAFCELTGCSLAGLLGGAELPRSAGLSGSSGSGAGGTVCDDGLSGGVESSSPVPRSSRSVPLPGALSLSGLGEIDRFWACMALAMLRKPPVIIAPKNDTSIKSVTI